MCPRHCFRTLWSSTGSLDSSNCIHPLHLWSTLLSWFSGVHFFPVSAIHSLDTGFLSFIQPPPLPCRPGSEPHSHSLLRALSLIDRSCSSISVVLWQQWQSFHCCIFLLSSAPQPNAPHLLFLLVRSFVIEKLHIINKFFVSPASDLRWTGSFDCPCVKKRRRWYLGRYKRDPHRLWHWRRAFTWSSRNFFCRGRIIHINGFIASFPGPAKDCIRNETWSLAWWHTYNRSSPLNRCPSRVWYINRLKRFTEASMFGDMSSFRSVPGVLGKL